jgi:hypothetical protein
MSEQNNNVELTKVEQIESTALYLLTKAEIDTQIATAKAFPRSLTLFRDKALSMATFSEDIAASCTYALPRGGSRLEGPSIRLAEIVAASYTNVQYGGRVIANDGKMITAQGVCIDLENNVKATVEVNRKITGKDGKPFNQDMQVMTGNAAIAIAVRNAIFKVIPGALVSAIQEKAKEVARGSAETLVVRRDKAIAYFKSIGVKEDQLCSVLEIKKVEDIDLDKLETLTGMKAAIKNGEATVQSLFESAKDDVSIEDVQMLFEMKKEALTPAELRDAERIINGKEVKSYKKLQTLLIGK